MDSKSYLASLGLIRCRLPWSGSRWECLWSLGLSSDQLCPRRRSLLLVFLREACTDRSVAGLVAEVGICQSIQMSRFWEMDTIYKTKPPATKLEETSWGKLNLDNATKPAMDSIEEDMVIITKGDKDHAPIWIRKGEGHSWLQNCQKPVDIKVVDGWFGWAAREHIH